MAPGALTPWNIPEQRDVDTVVALAHKGILFLCDLGYCKIQALGRLATAGASVCCRLNPQTNIDETVAGRVESVPLAAFLRTVAPDRLRLEQAIFIGEKAQIASRLIAVRRPEAVQQTTTQIPIVMTTAEEPVAFGLAKSLARPGGNITGVAVVPGAEIYSKNLEWLSDGIHCHPGASAVGGPAQQRAHQRARRAERTGRYVAHA